jgi:hypothetical protein
MYGGRLSSPASKGGFLRLAAELGEQQTLAYRSFQ